MFRSLKLFVPMFALVLSACESAPRIHSEAETGVDFTAFKTFKFVPEPAEKGKAYDSFTVRYLRDSIEGELNARGITQSEDADLLVNYNINTKEKIRSTSSPSASVGYYGYRGRPGYSYGVGFGTDTEVRQYTEGTLNIDVVDAKRNHLIWEGVAIGSIKEDDIDGRKERIYDAVKRIFTKYPVAVVAEEK